LFGRFESRQRNSACRNDLPELTSQKDPRPPKVFIKGNILNPLAGAFGHHDPVAVCASGNGEWRFPIWIWKIKGLSRSNGNLTHKINAQTGILARLRSEAHMAAAKEPPTDTPVMAGQVCGLVC